ncbi:MAG: class I SAM-dependent methyltransferase [Thermoanaerobaculia bacterium]
MSFPDHFSALASGYARHRPGYPPELFDWLAAAAPGRQRAWDAATGSGQAAAGLTERFVSVVATDASLAQVAAARRAAGLLYTIAMSEASPLLDQSFDLVAIGQALHWFDLGRFWPEVRRVLRPRGVVAAWTYDRVEVSPDVDRVLEWFNGELIAPYWPPERRHVETGYRDLSFPFARLHPPALAMEVEWSREELVGYLATWSSVGRYREALAEDPIGRLRAPLAAAWGSAARRRLRWPLTVLAGRSASDA